MRIEVDDGAVRTAGVVADAADGHATRMNGDAVIAARRAAGEIKRAIVARPEIDDVVVVDLAVGGIAVEQLGERSVFARSG